MLYMYAKIFKKMIHSICGLQNSGKTLIAVFHAFNDFLKGKKILSNINLAFPHYKINRDLLLWLAINQPQLYNISFLLDEFWIMFDSNSQGDVENKIISYLLLQSSKNNWYMYFTAQDNSQNIKRLRKNMHRFTQCERHLKINNNYVKVPVDERDLTNFKTENGIPFNDILHIQSKNFKMQLTNDNELVQVYKSTLYIPSKPLFKLYDTTEKINIIGV